MYGIETGLATLYTETNQLDQAEPSDNSNISAQDSDINKKNPNYIESHAPLENRAPIQNKQELMEMYPECFNGSSWMLLRLYVSHHTGS